jgi:hypothetical protein
VRAFARRQRSSVLSGEGGGVSWGSHPLPPRPHHNPQRGPTPEPVDARFLEAQMAAFVASLMRHKPSAGTAQGHKNTLPGPQGSHQGAKYLGRKAEFPVDDVRIHNTSGDRMRDIHQQQSPCERLETLGYQGMLASTNDRLSSAPSHQDDQCTDHVISQEEGGEGTSTKIGGLGRIPGGEAGEGGSAVGKDRAKTLVGYKGGASGTGSGRKPMSGKSGVQPRPAWALTAEAAEAAEEDEEARILGFVDELDAEGLENSEDLAELSQVCVLS